MGQLISLPGGRERPPALIKSGLNVTTRELARTLGIRDIWLIEATGTETLIKRPFEIGSDTNFDDPQSTAIRVLSYRAHGTNHSLNVAFAYFVLEAGKKLATIVQPVDIEGQSLIYRLRDTGVEPSILTTPANEYLTEASRKANRAIARLSPSELRHRIAIEEGYLS
jgi:hypothetical protein